MLRNSKDAWGVAAKAFHWSIALLILIEVPAGFIMSRTYGAKDPVQALWQMLTSNYHHTAGLLILLIAGLRLVWRLTNPPPEPAIARPRWETWLGGVTHWLLYGLLILIPLSGWASLSALADSKAYGPTHLWIFGADGFAPGGLAPRIVPPVAYDDKANPFGYGFFARGHRYLLWSGLALLTLHIAAALRHHFVLRDSTLMRMLPVRWGSSKVSEKA